MPSLPPVTIGPVTVPIVVVMVVVERRQMRFWPLPATLSQLLTFGPFVVVPAVGAAEYVVTVGPSVLSTGAI